LPEAEEPPSAPSVAGSEEEVTPEEHATTSTDAKRATAALRVTRDETNMESLRR